MLHDISACAVLIFGKDKMDSRNLFRLFVLALTVPLGCWVCASDVEAVCSKFPFEEQMLEKMIRTEIKVEDMVKDIKNTQEHVRTILEGMENKMIEFANDSKRLEENVIKTLTAAKTELDAYKEEMKKEMVSFKDDIKSEIDSKMTEIEKFTDNSTRELEDFKDTLTAEIDDKKGEVDKYLTDVTEQLDDFTRNITNAVQKKVTELELLEVKLGNPVVAFNVHKPSYLSLGTDETFQYSEVLLNKGEGFNASTGKFNAPITGLYYFSAHVCAVAGEFVHYGIVVGDTVLASSSQREDTDSSCGSVSVITTVTSGVEVFVKCLYGSSHMVENSYRWNSFIGALVH